MTLSATVLCEVAWAKTRADPPVERGAGGCVSSSNTYTTPDAADLSITANLFIAVDWTPVGTGWRPSTDKTLASKWGGAGARSYHLQLAASGLLRLGWSADGTAALTADSTIPVPFTGNERGRVGVGINVNNGAGSRVIDFYWSRDSRRWTLFETLTVAGTTSIFDSTAAFAVGYRGTSTEPIAATDVVHEIWLRNAKSPTAGTLRSNPHFHDSAVFDGNGNGVDAQGHTWSRAGTAAIDGDWTRIDDYLLDGSYRMGRTRETDLIEAGSATLRFRNTDRRFEPGYTSSPYSPNLVPGLPIRIRVHYDSQARSRWTGYVERWRADYGAAAEISAATAFCVDASKYLNRLLVSGYEAEVAVDEPLGWWKLDEATGSTATDSGSAGVNGSYANSPILAAAGPRDLSAAEFADTDSSHVLVGVLTGSNVDGPWTVEAWIKGDAAETAANQSIVSFGNSSVDDKLGVYINGGANATPYGVGVRAYRTGGSHLQSPVATASADWHHVAVEGVGLTVGVAFTGYTSGSVASGTSHTIPLPAAAAGALVIVTFSKTTNVTVTWPSGWTEIVDLGNSNGGGAVAYRLYAGAVDDSIEVVSSAATAPNYVAAAFSGVASVEYGSATGSTGNIDAPSKTASAAVPTTGMWVAAAAGRDTGGPAQTTPAGYTLARYRLGATLYNGVYYKAGSGGATENPAAQTTSSPVEAWCAATIALFPATATNEVVVYFDGVEVARYTDFDPTQDNGTMYVTIGKGRSSLGYLTGTVAQVAVYDKRLGEGRVAAHYAAALGDLQAETYDARIERLLDRVGWPGERVLDVGAYQLTAVDGERLPPTPLLELLRQAADSEGGAVYCDEEGRIRGRSSTTRATDEAVSLWTVGVGAGRSPRLILDDADTYNRVLIGVASTGEIVAADDLTGQAVDGLLVLDLGDLDLDDDDARTLAEALVDRYSSATRRFQSLIVLPEASPAANWPQLRDLQLGERITVSFTPTGGAGAIADEAHVEKVTAEWSADWYQETHETSPAG